MPDNKSVLDLSYKTSFDDNDSVVAEVGSVVSRVKMSTFKTMINQWNNISNKPFNSLDSEWFIVDDSALSLSNNITSLIHSHSNKNYIDKIGQDNNGKLLYNSDYVITKWNRIEDKPFNTLSADFVVNNGELSIDSSLLNLNWNNIDNKPFDSLSDDFSVSSGTMSISSAIKHTHSNKSVIDKFSEIDGQLLYDGSEIGSGLDFDALTDALTTGTLTGITITADTTNENFDITVTGLPTISIDSNGYWSIDGVSTGQKAQGDDGATPTINASDKHWYIDGTDTGVIAEGQAGQNGITPSIDSTTKHWIIGSTDTNIIAEGQDGVSPTVTVTEDSTKVTVTATDSSGTTTADIPKAATNIDIIKGRVDTVADLANVSSPYEGLVYLAGTTSATTFDKYIYVNRDNIARWEVLGGGASGDYIEEDVVTDVFDSTASYAVDDYVMYNNQLYKCTTAHTGAWNSSHFELTTILECISLGGLLDIVDEPDAQDIADSIATIWGS